MSWIIDHLWLIPAVPFAASLVILSLSKLRRKSAVVLAITGQVVALAMSVLAFLLTLQTQGFRVIQNFTWFTFGEQTLRLGFVLDPLAAAMLVMISLVGLCIFVFSAGYMAEDKNFTRFFAYMSFFSGAMLGLVIANSLLLLFIFWELVGLASYLLIGFWIERPSAAAAAKKAFITTRIGDMGFFLGMLWLYNRSGTLLFYDSGNGCLESAGLALLGASSTAIALLVFLGAVGKSAQFPLHVWLPDAMEGPTPVSALIHAATMVTAGVFLVTRAQPLFALTPGVLALIGWVGAFTALLAATMTCVESDIKHVLAYSTVSHLGLMMAAAGAFAAGAGFFHLLTHGVFKALLYLAAGAVIHAVGTNDIFRMGGLFRAMPQTAIVFIVGTLALAGVWPLAGFFSKEAVLAGVWDGEMVGPFVMLAVTAFLTAFYMFRVIFLAFFGSALVHEHTHDAPPLMAVPLWILALLTVGLGLLLATHGGDGPHGPGWLPALSLGLAVGGIGLAWATYQRELVSADRLAALFRPIDVLARRRYGIDALYLGLYRGFVLGFSRLIGWIDRYVVDSVLNVLSALTLRGSDLLRQNQTGKTKDYVYGVAFGALLLFVWVQ